MIINSAHRAHIGPTLAKAGRITVPLDPLPERSAHRPKTFCARFSSEHHQRTIEICVTVFDETDRTVPLGTVVVRWPRPQAPGHFRRLASTLADLAEEIAGDYLDLLTLEGSGNARA